VLPTCQFIHWGNLSTPNIWNPGFDLLILANTLLCPLCLFLPLKYRVVTRHVCGTRDQRGGIKDQNGGIWVLQPWDWDHRAWDWDQQSFRDQAVPYLWDQGRKLTMLLESRIRHVRHLRKKWDQRYHPASRRRGCKPSSRLWYKPYNICTFSM